MKTVSLNDWRYEDINLGDCFSFERIIDKAVVKTFVDLTGDASPLHVDENYARGTEFGDPIVQGMLLSSYFSTLIGMLCPGKRATYLSQDLRFRKPLKRGGQIIVSGEVIKKYDALRIIELKTIIKDDRGTILVDGVAKAKVRD